MTKTSATGNRRIAQEAGFSLVELLVALTIVTLLASSISFLIVNRQVTLKSAALEVVQQMRFMRLRSIQNDLPYQVRIDLKTNSFQFSDSSVELPEETALTVRTAQHQLIDGDTAGITFYPDASSSGGVITLENKDELYEISIVWISGKIQTRFESLADAS